MTYQDQGFDKQTVALSAKKSPNLHLRIKIGCKEVRTLMTIFCTAETESPGAAASCWCPVLAPDYIWKWRIGGMSHDKRRLKYVDKIIPQLHYIQHMN
jgi:hypothetical protein